MNLVGETCAGDPHARFDERGWETELTGHRAQPRLYLAVPPGRRTTNRRLAWILTGYRNTSGLLTLHIGDINFYGGRVRGEDVLTFL